MGINKAFSKELLVVGVLWSDEELCRQAETAMEARWGPIRTKTEKQEFLWTDYYNTEMCTPIYRQYLEFDLLVDPSLLADIKITTNSIEQSCAIDGKRKVNLDPGLLGAGRFVLATTKDRAHRIPLTKGIFVELTLVFEKGMFHALPWTYPDWADEPIRKLLAEWRHRLFSA